MLQTVDVTVLILLLRDTGEAFGIPIYAMEVGIREQACGVQTSAESLRDLAGGYDLKCNDQFYDVAGWLRQQLSFQLPECKSEGVLQLQGANCAAHALRYLKLFRHYVSNLQDVVPSEWASTYSDSLQLLEEQLVDLLLGLCPFCSQLAQEEGQPASTCRLAVNRIFVLDNGWPSRDRSWQEINTMGNNPASTCSPEHSSAFLNQTHVLGPRFDLQPFRYSEDDFTKAVVSVSCSLTQFLSKLHLVDEC